MVIVHDFELTGKADDATGTSGGQLLAKSVDKDVTGGNSCFAGGASADGVTEKVRGEFTVCDDTGSVVVINIEKGVEILLNVNKTFRNYDKLTWRVGIIIPIFSMALANSSGLKSPLSLMSKNLNALSITVSSDWTPVAFYASLALRSFSKLKLERDRINK